MANQLNKGRTFNPGDTVEAADLNNLVDLATALEGIISNQGADTVILATDKLLFWRSPGVLHRGVVSTMPGAGTVTNVSWKSTYPQPTTIFTGGVDNNSTTPQIKLSLNNQGPNKVLVGPATGPGDTPSFRKLVPADMAIAISAIPASNDVDFSLGNTFSFTLPNNPATTLHLKNGFSGQRVIVQVHQYSGGGKLLHWDAPLSGESLRWPSGDEPVITAGAGHIDIFEFVCIGNGGYNGICWGKDMLS